MPRIRRATRGTSTMVTATITLVTEPPATAISAIASRMAGIDITPSMMRITTASRARVEADSMPTAVPITDDSSATLKPTNSEICAP